MSKYLSNFRGWFIYLLDPNGLWMHVVYGLPAVVFGFSDPFFFRVMPRDALLLGAAGVCLIPPFIIPVAGIDRKQEKVELFFLTFGLSSALMTILGLGIGASLVGEGTKIDGDSWGSAALAWAYFNALAVIISFGRVGHMSRDQRHRLYEQVLWQMPQVIQAAHRALTLSRDVVLADKFARALFGATSTSMNSIVIDGRLGGVAKEVVEMLRGAEFLYCAQLEEALTEHPRTMSRFLVVKTGIKKRPRRGGTGIRR